MRKPKRRWSSNDCSWPSETTFSRRKCERTATAAWIFGVSSRRSTKLGWHTNSRQNQAWRISSIRRFFRLLTNDGSNRRAMSAFGPKRTFLVAPHISAFGGKADMTIGTCPLSRSLLGVKRTCPFALHMSANDPKRLPLCADMMFGKDGGRHSRAEPLPCRATTFGRQSPEFVVNSRSLFSCARDHREYYS